MFEQDVFISYAHLSNKDDQAGQNGWVAKFHTDLKIALDELLGREASIWRDNKMRLGTNFSEAIANRLAKTRVLLCVLSPAYVQSSWCKRELEEFRRAALANGGLQLGEQSRIISVVKTPVAAEELGFDQTLYCRFYDTADDGGGFPRAFSQMDNGYKHDHYEAKLMEVAWAIAELLKGLGDQTKVDTNQTIYLAETSSDREGDRQRIRDELEARKFIVLPREPLPSKRFQEYAEAVRKNLNQSFMSVHLFGQNYGPIPENADSKSIVDIQNELAVERYASDHSFKRVIWIPDRLADVEEQQTKFMANIRGCDLALQGADLVEKPFEDLKTRLLQVLLKRSVNGDSDNLATIYLMCDRQDYESAVPIAHFLHDKGYQVIPPPEPNGGGVLKYHKTSLLKCDGALTIYGKTNFQWVHGRYEEVVNKVKGWGRDKKISCTAILPTDPETPPKKMLFTLDLAKILPACYDGLSPAALEKPLNEFIDALEQELAA